MLKQVLLVSIVASLMLAGSAQAGLIENFEGYADGALLNTAGGWTSSGATYYLASYDGAGYNPSKAAQAPDDSNVMKAAKAVGASETEMTFRGYHEDSGSWVYVHWQEDASNSGASDTARFKVKNGTITFEVPGGSEQTASYTSGNWYDYKITAPVNGVNRDVTGYYKLSSSSTWIPMGAMQTSSGWTPGGVHMALVGLGAVDDLIFTPEPATMLVLGLGGLLALLRRRR